MSLHQLPKLLPLELRPHRSNQLLAAHLEGPVQAALRLATSHRRETRCTALTLRHGLRPEPPDLVHSSHNSSDGRAAAASPPHSPAKRCLLKNKFSNLLQIRDRPSNLTRYSICDHQYNLTGLREARRDQKISTGIPQPSRVRPALAKSTSPPFGKARMHSF